MKIILYIFIIINLILSIFLGVNLCKYSLLSENEIEYINKIEKLKVEKANLENIIATKNIELSNIEKNIEKNKKIENGNAKYIMKLNISQTHFSFDLSEHLKDASNDIDIVIEVSKDFYDKYSVGDYIADNFRVGSFIFKGSLGNWKVKVKEKNIV